MQNQAPKGAEIRCEMTKPKKPYKPVPQKKLAYTVFYYVMRPFLFLRYGYRRPKDLPARYAKEPITVLGNHVSNLDFLFAAVAFYPKRLNFLVSSHFFGQKPLALILRMMQCVPKEQFSADVAAIRDMRSIVSAGGSIGIYPEGEVNGIGMTGEFPDSIGKLCKLLKAPVYTVRTKGAYLSRPKWGPGNRRGRVETDILCAADAEEVKSLSPDELNRRIAAGIFHDEYAWQEKARIPFSGKNRAENLHYLLYRCPKCGKEFTTRTEGDEIYCSVCCNRGRMNKLGFLVPTRERDIIPTSPREWIEYQRQALREAFSDPEYRLTAPCFLQYHIGEKKLRHEDVGEGTVTLSRDGIAYEGTAEGKPFSFRYRLQELYKFPFTAGLHFEIPPAERTTAIRPKEPQAVWQFVLALPILRQMAKEESEE